MRLQFGLEAYAHRSKPIASQRLINCYLEKAPTGSKNPVALIGAYGIEDAATPGEGPHRGGTVVKGICYVVSGNALYRVNRDLTATLLGTIPNGDRVTIAGDGTRLMIVTNGAGYVWNGTEVLPVTDPDFPGADSGPFYLDGYFIVTKEGALYISDPFDPLSWNALDFASAEASPDDIVGGIVEKREFFAGGQDSFEVFVNTGNSDFPLERVSSGFSEIGLLAKNSLAKADNSVFFVASDFTVRRMNGYTPGIISTEAISQEVEDLVDKDSLFGFAWSENNHTFYALTSSTWTFVYDCATQLWHQRKSYQSAFWRPAFAVNAYQRWFVGDQTSNRLGALSPSTFAEWGQHQIMLATAYVSAADNARIDVPRLEVVFEQGVGLVTGQGSNPQMMMRQSIDDGRKWGNEHWRDMGKIGETFRKASWNRCGHAEQRVSRVFEVSISDAVRRSLNYAEFGPPPGER
jgi:hypothetical protein